MIFCLLLFSAGVSCCPMKDLIRTSNSNLMFPAKPATFFIVSKQSKDKSLKSSIIGKGATKNEAMIYAFGSKPWIKLSRSIDISEVSQSEYDAIMNMD